MIICSMARALNVHHHQHHHHHSLANTSNDNDNSKSNKSNVEMLSSQRQIAQIAEMIHVASLIHDDIIDNSDLRRGKHSVNSRWGCQKAVLAGDYILSSASQALARIGNTRVVETLSIVLDDLVKGELMQLGTKELERERFEHYSAKTYKKTASLIANSCKAVAILLVASRQQQLQLQQPQQLDLVEMAFECGKNVGIAFQLIDDVLDFTSHSAQLGKPGCGADLRLGLATAPVFFAAATYPTLNTMIMRRFSGERDVAQAFDMVTKSEGIEKTRQLARQYCDKAVGILDKLAPSSELLYLKNLIETFVIREK